MEAACAAWRWRPETFAAALSRARARSGGGPAPFSFSPIGRRQGRRLLSQPLCRRLVGSAGYIYSLSKRTSLYGVGSLGQDKFSQKGEDTVKPSYGKVLVGLRHKF